MGKKVVAGHHAAFIRRTLIWKPLVENGYEVVADTGNGAELVDLCRQHKPDLVILDIIFADGVYYTEIFPQIRKENPSIKVLMCSDDMEKVTEAIKNGANGYLVPPFKSGTLLSKVKELIG